MVCPTAAQALRLFQAGFSGARTPDPSRRALARLAADWCPRWVDPPHISTAASAMVCPTAAQALRLFQAGFSGARRVWSSGAMSVVLMPPSSASAARCSAAALRSALERVMRHFEQV